MHKILKDSMIYLICELLSKAMPFLLLPYFTRVLNVENFGYLGLYTSLQAFLIIFINLSFDGAIAKYYYKYGRRSFDTLLLLALLIVIFNGVVLILVVLISAERNHLLFFAVVTAALQSIFNVILMSYQCSKRPKIYFFLQVSFALISTVLTVIFFKVYTYSFNERALSVILTLAFLVLPKLISLVKKHIQNKRFSVYRIKIYLFYLLSFGSPLIIHQLGLYAKGQLDRLVIAHYFNIEQLAVYSAGVQVASVISVIFMALNKALVPYFFEACKLKKINQSNVLTLFKISIFLSLVPGLIVSLLPQEFFVMILSEQYIKSIFFIRSFSFGFGFILPYLVAVNYLFYINQNLLIAKISIITSMLHIGLLVILSQLGIEYIPIALLLSNVSCCVLLYFCGVRRYAL